MPVMDVFTMVGVHGVAPGSLGQRPTVTVIGSAISLLGPSAGSDICTQPFSLQVPTVSGTAVECGWSR